jgi:hypothetical protein
VGYIGHGGDCEPDSEIVVSDTGMTLSEGYEMDVDVAEVLVLVVGLELAEDLLCDVAAPVPVVVPVGVDVYVGAVVPEGFAVPVGVDLLVA